MVLGSFMDTGKHESFEGYSYLMLMTGEETREHYLLYQGHK